MIKFCLVALVAWGSINVAEAQKKSTHKTTVAKKTITKKKVSSSKKASASAKPKVLVANAPKASLAKTQRLTPKQLAEVKRANDAKEEILKADTFVNGGQLAEALVIYEKYKDTPYMDAKNFKNMAVCYRSVGKGVVTNLGLAKTYFEKSATLSNDAESYLALGQLLLVSGNGLTRDPALANNYLGKALQKGNKEAAYELGRLYLVGAENLEKDETKALILLEAAGESGISDAQWLLGNTYSKGTVVTPKNMTKAKYWYSKYKDSSQKKTVDL
jgi:TPR repeat protein